MISSREYRGKLYNRGLILEGVRFRLVMSLWSSIHIFRDEIDWY